jgi:hypothetical protein
VTVKVTVNPDTQQPILNITDLALTTGGPVVKNSRRPRFRDIYNQEQYL